MNRTGYYLLIAALASTGLVLGVVLFPFYHQLSLMFLYDRQYHKALPRYQELYQEGEHSAEVVAPLVQLELEEANESQAIHIVAEYATQHPDSLDALEMLGNLLKENHYLHAYVHNLRQIDKIKPSLAHLREERELYDYFGEEESIISTLEKITQSPDAKSSEYRDLAYLYASKGESDEALKTLRTMLANIALSRLSIEDAQFAITYFAETGHTQEASDLAEQLINQQKSKKTTLALAQTFMDENLPTEGLRLLDRLPTAEQLSPDAITLRLNLLWTVPDGQKTVWDYLQKLYNQGDLPPPLRIDLLDLALSYEDLALATTLVNSTPLEQIEEILAIRLIRMAITQNQPALARTLQHQLGADYVKEYPLIGLALDVALSDRSEEQESAIITTEKIAKWNNRERAVLTELYAAKRQPAIAKAILTQIDSWKTLEPDLRIDLALLYIEYHMTEQGQTLARALPDSQTSDRDLIELLFETADGHTEGVIARLNALDKVPEGSLILLYGVAEQREHAVLALNLAQRLINNYPSLPNRARLGNALVMNGRFNEGVAILTDLYQDGYSQAAAPLLIALARASRVESVYQQPFEQLLAQLLQDESLSKVQWREMAFRFIDLKAKPEAIQILQILAKGQSFDNLDVQSLLQLWGEHPGNAGLAWIAERARQADRSELMHWLKALVDVHAAQLVVEIVTEEDLETKAIADIYLTALLELKERPRIEAFIAQAYLNEEDAKRLKVLGKAARDLDLKDLAQVVFEKVLALAPNDLETIKILGELAFAKGSLSCARWYLAWYLIESPGDYLSTGLYAELLWQDKERETARAFYEVSLAHIDNLKKKDLAAARSEAHIYYRLDYLCKAIDSYCTLVAQYPTDISLRTEFANLLIDIGANGDAADLLYEDLPQPKADDPLYLIEGQDAELAIVRQRLFRDLHRFGTALQISRQALLAAPDQASLWAARAELELAIGRWQRALYYLDEARDRETDNEAYYKLCQSIWDDHRSFLDVQTENRLTTPAQHERFTRIFDEWRINSGLRLILQCERDWMTLDAYTVFSTGEVIPFDGIRHKGKVSLIREWDSGAAVLGTIYGGDGVIGGGLAAQILDFCGGWRLYGEYHEPCWDITESTIEHGARNRIGIERRQFLTTRFNVTGGYSYQQYNVFANTRTGTSWEVQALVSYQLDPLSRFMRQFPEGTMFTYNLLCDTEIVLFQLTKFDAQGQPYQPLDLTSRETYTGFFGVNVPLAPCTTLEGTAGYYYDRIGKGGGTVGNVALTVGCKGYPQVRVEFSHYVSAQTSTSTVDSFIFNVKVPF